MAGRHASAVQNHGRRSVSLGFARFSTAIIFFRGIVGQNYKARLLSGFFGANRYPAHV
jgi:hypothetical protein